MITAVLDGARITFWLFSEFCKLCRFPILLSFNECRVFFFFTAHIKRLAFWTHFLFGLVAFGHVFPKFTGFTFRYFCLFPQQSLLKFCGAFNQDFFFEIEIELLLRKVSIKVIILTFLFSSKDQKCIVFDWICLKKTFDKMNFWSIQMHNAHGGIKCNEAKLWYNKQNTKKNQNQKIRKKDHYEHSFFSI